MTIASELQALATDVQNARTAITNKGGTVTPSGGTSQLATDIATIPSGIEDVSTAQGMADRLVAGNLGRMFHFTGETTADYVNGRYYKVIGGACVSVDLTAIGTNKVWKESAVRPSDYDEAVYGGVWQSDNYGQNNTNAVCKITVSGITSFTILINSYAESNYDYTIASSLDAESIPTAYSAGVVHTRGFQKDPTGTLAGNWKTYTYTMDTAEHFIYIVYRKDGSAQYNNDRGYFTYTKTTGIIPEYAEYLHPDGNEVITDTAVHDVSGKATAQVVDAALISNNIRKDINILGVTGTYDPGGSGSGYKVYFKCTGFDSYGYCRINDSADYDFKCISDYNPRASIMVLPTTGVEKIKFYGFSHSGIYPHSSSSWIRWRPHADDWLTWTGDNGTDFSIGGSGVELTLTGDIDIMASYATCLTGDTLILMADGTEKRLDEVYVGDMVLGASGPVEVIYCDSDCNKWHNTYDVWTFDDGTVVRTVHPHRFYNTNRREFVYMDQWTIGEHALNKDGEKVALVDHQTIDDDIRHYTLFTSDSNTYYANGLLSGNRCSVYSPDQSSDDEETLRIV